MKVSVFKKTSDDWYPSYSVDGWVDLNLVEVIYTKTGPNPPDHSLFRVCVWGGDNCGMEKDFINEFDAWSCYLQVISLKDITRNVLINFGFTSVQ